MLLLLVEYSELGALAGVDDGEDLGYSFSDVMSVGGCQYGCRVLGILCKAYILFNLAEAPPETFCVRSWMSSVRMSFNCFNKSSLPFPHNWAVLIFDLSD